MNLANEFKMYTKAGQRGVRKALRESALLGNSVPIAGPGKNEVIWITPAQILEDIRKQEEAERLEELAEAAARAGKN